MIQNKKVMVVMPAYNASKTLEKTYNEIPFDIVDDVILVDDFSQDDTIHIAKELGVNHIVQHDRNLGYGGNQKSCYREALRLRADIVVMMHPDYQYTPKLIPAMVHLIASGVYQVVLGSRILGKGALAGGMPRYKYFANRLLTLLQNILLSKKLSEYHTGYRAFSREVLERINFEANSNDFVFDNQMLAQVFYAGYEIAEITCPTNYFPEASTIGFCASTKYGFGVIATSLKFILQRCGIAEFDIFKRTAIYRDIEGEGTTNFRSRQ